MTLDDFLSTSTAIQSSQQFALLIPILYTTVELRSNEHCREILHFLGHRPDITRHVRRLVTRPNHPTWVALEEELDESWVADKIVQLAHDLHKLHTFVWDGLQTAPDNIWVSLRTSYVPNIFCAGHDDYANEPGRGQMSSTQKCWLCCR